MLGLAADDEESRDGAKRLLQHFAPSGLRSVVLTRGELGTELLTGDDGVRGEVARFERHPCADNVGAGDACSAGLLWGWHNNWSPEQTVTLANRLGAFVASQPGATPLLPQDIFASGAASISRSIRR